jgi:hypothetical protein
VPAAGEYGFDLHQSAGLGIRQGTQQHAVHDAEDRCARADAERERQYRDAAEAWILGKATHGKPKIVEHVNLL